VPARRNFLKSNAVEMRHILDEFQRVAIAHADIFFSLHHNTTEIFHLPAGNLRQRIVGIFGNTLNKKLVPINEETDILKITGYVGKPEFAKKTRGEQLFYVNQRFIKSGYLNHAIMGAYEDLLAKETYPLYVVFLEIDPARIDINVHPTKQEIKFDDEKLVYNYLKVAIRHALGQYSITPTLDFDQERNFSSYQPNKDQNIGMNFTQAGSKVNTPGTGTPNNFSQPPTSPRDNSNLKNWEKMYEGLSDFDQKGEDTNEAESLTIESQWSEGQDQEGPGDFTKKQKKPYQIHGTYIVSQLKSGFLLIDQQAAHERILYERYLVALEQQESFTQKELFPKTITVSQADAEVLKSIGEQINALGFDLQDFGKNTFVIHGIPADLPSGYDEQKIIETLLEQYKNNLDLKLGIHDNIARSMARSASIKKGQKMTPLEMQELIDQLFACDVPFKNPAGKNCFITFELDDLAKQFEA